MYYLVVVDGRYNIVEEVKAGSNEYIIAEGPRAKLLVLARKLIAEKVIGTPKQEIVELRGCAKTFFELPAWLKEMLVTSGMKETHDGLEQWTWLDVRTGNRTMLFKRVEVRFPYHTRKGTMYEFNGVYFKVTEASADVNSPKQLVFKLVRSPHLAINSVEHDA